MECVHCGIEFDQKKKEMQSKLESRRFGRINECIECASEEPAKLTGVMVYGHKTAGSIQINRDPRLTQYMLACSPSAGTRYAMSQNAPKVKPDSVSLFVTDVAKRR